MDDGNVVNTGRKILEIRDSATPPFGRLPHDAVQRSGLSFSF